MKTRWSRFSRSIASLTLFVALTTIFAGPGTAREASDEIGNWLIYNGTFRFSPRWSLFTEAQLRLYEIASNPNEVFVRASAHYDFPNSQAMAGLGYLRATTWSFDDAAENESEQTENRIYQQFGLKQRWSRSLFEHRYRLEERWIAKDGSDKADFSLRVRYRLQITTPLNREIMEPGAWFLNFYDEIFFSFDDPRLFDQNRLYGAGGYQFSTMANLQIGMLWQARSTADFWRLQFFYTHNFDFQS